MDALQRARAAFAAREWAAADASYRECEAMEAADFDSLGETAHWLGRPDDTIAAYGEAYRLHCAAGAHRRAALSAFMLAIFLRLKGEAAQADGWLSRAQRLLAGAEEGPEHGYPLYLQTAGLMGVDLDAAVASARQMQDLGRRYGDDTLVALGVFFEGRALVKQARVREGLALLDEAMLAALSDRLKPMWTGAIYCGLLDACHELVDLRRAGEWTEATRRWCSPLPVASLYPGICRVHWAEVLDLRGAWEQAEVEAVTASRDMAGIDVFAVADAYYTLGEIRRRRGDLDGAEAAYLQAHEVGRDPQPGLALLRLAQGRTDAAAASISAALASFAGSRLERAPLRAAHAEIALATGDVEGARAAAAEVLETAELFESVGLRAVGLRCQGAVALARGEAVTALGVLRLAFSHWQELDAPYEVARTRMLLAEAYELLGDVDTARRERSVARATFTSLGAVGDLRALTEGDDPPAGLTARECEVLRLVAGGHGNREIAATLFISEKTVARHIANVYVKLGVSSRSAATAFAYEHDLVQPARPGVH